MLIVILIAAAIPLYTYNVYILLKGAIGRAGAKVTTGNSRNEADVNLIKLTKIITPVHFEKKGRSPFVRYLKDETVLTKSEVVHPKKQIVQKESEKAPTVKVNGIMWNPENPIAMLNMADGSSAIVKTGQKINNLTIKKIEKTFIVIMSAKREYRINR